jgi:hypothetical protein
MEGVEGQQPEIEDQENLEEDDRYPRIYVAFVTAAIAEPFVNRRIHETLDAEIGDTEAELLAEIRDIRGRLEGVERQLHRMGARRAAQALGAAGEHRGGEIRLCGQ